MRRRALRLKDYDYSQAGAYFVTICTEGRECLFGEVAQGEMRLNDAGKMIEVVWNGLSGRFPNIKCDEFVIMPNHVHGVIIIMDHDLGVGAPLVGAHDATVNHRNLGAGTRPAPTLGDVVRVFKSRTSVEYIHGVPNNHWKPFPGKLWQRNYYERVIRNENELFETRRYIQENPLKWDLDPENPFRQALEEVNRRHRKTLKRLAQ